MHAWTVPGVISNLNLATVFLCTNTLDSTVIIGVEVFGLSGGTALNNASATSLAVAPGGTAIFGTAGLPPTFVVDSDLGIGGNVSKGSARVLVTTNSKASQSILCNAILSDKLNDPPAVITSLPVVRKTTQQGD